VSDGMPAERVDQAVILAAGEGTRLRPLTYSRPKVLIPVANRAFLGHQLDLLMDIGIRRAAIVAGYRKDVLEDWLVHNAPNGMELIICHQKEPRGTADAIRAAKDAVSGPFIALNGDVLLDGASLQKMASSPGMSVAAKRVPNPWEYGVFLTRRGFVIKVAEKVENPPSDLANVGVYVFHADVFDWIDRTPPNPKRKEIEITDTLQSMIDAGMRVRCHRVREWHELGKPWDVIGLNELFLRRNVGRTFRGTQLSSAVRIGEGSLVAGRARIIGPSIIGRECSIAGRAVVGPYCSVGDGSKIKGARVEGCVLMEGCRIEQGATVGYSVLGPNSVVGAGATLADRDARARGVRVRIKDRWLDSGRKRLGAVLGDGVVIGEGAFVSAGMMLDPNTVIAPRSKILQ